MGRGRAQQAASGRLLEAAGDIDRGEGVGPQRDPDPVVLPERQFPFAVECDISKAELLSIFQSRVEAHMKHLIQRYQIDFTKSNLFGTPATPVVAPAAEVDAQ